MEFNLDTIIKLIVDVLNKVMEVLGSDFVIALDKIEE